jgi:hypothetical protein
MIASSCKPFVNEPSLNDHKQVYDISSFSFESFVDFVFNLFLLLVHHSIRSSQKLNIFYSKLFPKTMDLTGPAQGQPQPKNIRTSENRNTRRVLRFGDAERSSLGTIDPLFFGKSIRTSFELLAQSRKIPLNLTLSNDQAGSLPSLPGDDFWVTQSCTFFNLLYIFT